MEVFFFLTLEKKRKKTGEDAMRERQRVFLRLFSAVSGAIPDRRESTGGEAETRNVTRTNRIYLVCPMFEKRNSSSLSSSCQRRESTTPATENKKIIIEGKGF